MKNTWAGSPHTWGDPAHGTGCLGDRRNRHGLLGRDLHERPETRALMQPARPVYYLLILSDFAAFRFSGPGPRASHYFP